MSVSVSDQYRYILGIDVAVTKDIWLALVCVETGALIESYHDKYWELGPLLREMHEKHGAPYAIYVEHAPGNGPIPQQLRGPFNGIVAALKGQWKGIRPNRIMAKTWQANLGYNDLKPMFKDCDQPTKEFSKFIFKERFGYDAANDDEADSAGVATCGRMLEGIKSLAKSDERKRKPRGKSKWSKKDADIIQRRNG